MEPDCLVAREWSPIYPLQEPGVQANPQTAKPPSRSYLTFVGQGASTSRFLTQLSGGYGIIERSLEMERGLKANPVQGDYSGKNMEVHRHRLERGTWLPLKQNEPQKPENPSQYRFGGTGDVLNRQLMLVLPYWLKDHAGVGQD